MIKSRTHSLKGSPSTEKLPSPSPPRMTALPSSSGTTFTPRSLYPMSPQLIFGEEIIHYSHQQHALSMINLPDLFRCAGCLEDGAGKRYTCQQCDFHLHEFCALPYPNQLLKNHPFHYQHNFYFHSKPAKGGIAKSRCDICGEPMKGYAFRCGACSFSMHPCCEMLPVDIVISNHPHKLQLLPPAASSSADLGFVCGECKKRRSGRVYGCTVCGYYLHAVCAKSIVNGLYDSGIKGTEKHTSKLGAAARLASRVVSNFIGGLMESIGEGLGQALVQNVTKGKARQPKKKKKKEREG